MRILNTRRDPKGPTDADCEELRRLFREALRDPHGFIVLDGGSVEIGADGGIVLKGKPKLIVKS